MSLWDQLPQRMRLKTATIQSKLVSCEGALHEAIGLTTMNENRVLSGDQAICIGDLNL